MSKILQWLVKHGEVVVRAGELIMELGRAIKNSIKKPGKPENKG